MEKEILTNSFEAHLSERSTFYDFISQLMACLMILNSHIFDQITL
jgi:hypothetical protein